MFRGKKKQGKLESGTTEKVSNIDWTKESTIPTDIQKLLENEQKYVAGSPVGNIFLTGGNGLLGVFLLLELLKTTSCKVYCLIRSSDKETSEEKLKSAIKYYRHWDEIASIWEERVIVIDGDLQFERLGLSEEKFNELCRLIDVIYHNGAWVNTILPYEKLRAANVGGTLEILRLSLNHHIKPIHYVSTLSIYTKMSGNEELPSRDLARIEMKGGYGASKLISEILLQKAADVKLPLNVYRLGTISGDSETGSLNTVQFLNRFLCGIAKLGYAPNIDTTFDMVPANSMAHVICKLSSSYGGIYNLFNKETLTVNQIAKCVDSYRYPIKVVEFGEWKKILKEEQQKNSNNALLPLISYFDVGFPQLGSYGTTNSQKKMKEFGFEWPEINQEVIFCYLGFLKEEGLI